jgi:transcriptional regulator with XRE-family HTH domain
MEPELAHALTAVSPAQLGGRVRAARVAAGLTQSQLAGQDASVAYLSRIESGQRRPSAALLETLAARLGVAIDYLVVGRGWEDARRLELLLDHAELSLVGGEAANALAQVREVLESPAIQAVPGGPQRAKYVEAATLDALGDEAAVPAFQELLESGPESLTGLKAATALSRIWRENGQLERAIACARDALRGTPQSLLGSDEGIRLSVTLAAALFTAGRTDEAAEICDRAIAEAERLSSPVARASAYWNTSIIRLEAGDMSEAISLAGRALHLLENTERVRDLGRLRTHLGAIMLRADPPRLTEAQEQLQIAERELDWSEATPADRARHDLVNARALFLSGAWEAASQRARSVLGSCDGLPLLGVHAMTLLGQIAWNAREHEEASGWYREAITLLTGAGADREAAQLWFDLGTLATEAGLTAEAADAFRRAAVSAGLQARLPVVTQPPSPLPRTTPHVPAGRL